MAKQVAEIDKLQEGIIKKHWPGKYTFVLERKAGTKLFGIDKNSVALRMPKYKFLNDILRRFGKPLSQTSVNISGEQSLLKIGEIVGAFAGHPQIAIIVDGGNLTKSKSSKILDITTDTIKILR